MPPKKALNHSNVKPKVASGYVCCPMRIAYLSFWPINDGLTQAMVLPVVRYMLAKKLVSEVVLFTPEYKADTVPPVIAGLVWHSVSLNAKNGQRSGFKQIIALLWGVWRQLRTDTEVDYIWARGSVIGVVAFLLSRLLRVPFVVESFEPHSDYMAESGAWKIGGLKYGVQKAFERWQTIHAHTLITVSKQYENRLRERKKRNKNLYTLPCSVDFDAFTFSAENRATVRSELGLSDTTTVGIYVGKFGDIYYREEFFKLMAALMAANPHYFQIVLTPMPAEAETQFAVVGITSSRYKVLTVAHDDVSAYLSASDIAFCSVKQSPSKRYCSPVKTAEYLACGLPVVISKDISDDSAFISTNAIGRVVDFDASHFEKHAAAIMELPLHTTRETIMAVGKTYRDQRVNFMVYDHVFAAICHR